MTLVENPAALGDALSSNGHRGNGVGAVASGEASLVAELRGYLAARLGPPSERVSS